MWINLPLRAEALPGRPAFFFGRCRLITRVAGRGQCAGAARHDRASLAVHHTDTHLWVYTLTVCGSPYISEQSVFGYNCYGSKILKCRVWLNVNRCENIPRLCLINCNVLNFCIRYKKDNNKHWTWRRMFLSSFLFYLYSELKWTFFNLNYDYGRQCYHESKVKILNKNVLQYKVTEVQKFVTEVIFIYKVTSL